jgi:hypothetical protein
MQIFIAAGVEGSTDIAFFKSIIEKIFEDIACECNKQVYIENEISFLKKTTGLGFVEQLISWSNESVIQYGANVLCIHADADADTTQKTIHTKIQPAKTALQETDKNTHCHNIVAIIPVQETEAWMLADTDLFRQEIGTKLNNVELDIHRAPETIADPKDTIITAIRTANQNLTRRRRHELSIGDLYESIGSKIDLSKLRLLPSFQAFEAEVREAFKFLGLL